MRGLHTLMVKTSDLTIYKSLNSVGTALQSNSIFYYYTIVYEKFKHY